MPTKTVTIQQLITDYAETIANEAGLDLDDYPASADGLASLLRDAASDMPGQVADWLDDVADDLAAIALLGDDGPKTQELLRNVDRVLYEAANDLA
jgi:hypothetical protein